MHSLLYMHVLVLLHECDGYCALRLCQFLVDCKHVRSQPMVDAENGACSIDA